VDKESKTSLTRRSGAFDINSCILIEISLTPFGFSVKKSRTSKSEVSTLISFRKLSAVMSVRATTTLSFASKPSRQNRLAKIDFPVPGRAVSRTIVPGGKMWFSKPGICSLNPGTEACRLITLLDRPCLLHRHHRCEDEESRQDRGYDLNET